MKSYERIIVRTEIYRRGTPYVATYTLSVLINLGEVDIMINDGEENLSKQFGIKFTDQECILPYLYGKKCIVTFSNDTYYFDRFIID